MTCPDCSTKILCKGEIPLCKLKPHAKQKPATWTDSPAVGGFPKLQSEPRRIHPVAFVTTVAVVVAALLAIAPYVAAWMQS